MAVQKFFGNEARLFEVTGFVILQVMGFAAKVGKKSCIFGESPGRWRFDLNPEATSILYMSQMISENNE
jgi:hypothetical protein